MMDAVALAVQHNFVKRRRDEQESKTEEDAYQLWRLAAPSAPPTKAEYTSAYMKTLSDITTRNGLPILLPPLLRVVVEYVVPTHLLYALRKLKTQDSDYERHDVVEWVCIHDPSSLDDISKHPGDCDDKEPTITGYSSQILSNFNHGDVQILFGSGVADVSACARREMVDFRPIVAPVWPVPRSRFRIPKVTDSLLAAACGRQLILVAPYEGRTWCLDLDGVNGQDEPPLVEIKCAYSFAGIEGPALTITSNAVFLSGGTKLGFPTQNIYRMILMKNRARMRWKQSHDLPDERAHHTMTFVQHIYRMTDPTWDNQIYGCENEPKDGVQTSATPDVRHDGTQLASEHAIQHESGSDDDDYVPPWGMVLVGGESSDGKDVDIPSSSGVRSCSYCSLDLDYDSDSDYDLNLNASNTAPTRSGALHAPPPKKVLRTTDQKDVHSTSVSKTHRTLQFPGHWESFAPLNHARKCHSATVVDGKLYVAGGITEDGNRMVQVDTIEVLHLGRWSVVASLPSHTEQTDSNWTLVHANGVLHAARNNRKPHGNHRPCLNFAQLTTSTQPPPLDDLGRCSVQSIQETKYLCERISASTLVSLPLLE